MASDLRGYSPAEAALYWAADHARPGAAVEVHLSAGERLDIRLACPHGHQATRRFREARLHVNADDDGDDLTVSPPADGRLSVKLRRVGFAVSDLAPLELELPSEVALIIIAAGCRLLHDRPEPRAVTIEAIAAAHSMCRPPIKPTAPLATASHLAPTWRP
jgi:hypothetical protein